MGNQIRQAITNARQLQYVALSIWVILAITTGNGESWARTRDLVATPPLMASPLQVIESRMRDSSIQRFESRMVDSPLELIGSPFGPYRFATLPNIQDLWATRRSISMLPAMIQFPRGMLLLLPAYVIPLTTTYPAYVSRTVVEEPAPLRPQPRSLAKPKFITLRCGQYVEVQIPLEGSLADLENQPC